MVLLPIGMIAGLVAMADIYSMDPKALRRHTQTLARAVGQQGGLWLVRSIPPNGKLCDRGQGRARLQPDEANPCLPDHCRLDDYVAWDEWKACKSQQLVADGWTGNEARMTAALAQVRNESTTLASGFDEEAAAVVDALLPTSI